jgi:hypothetical protein
VKKPVSKFAFQMRPAALHLGGPARGNTPFELFHVTGRLAAPPVEVGLCTLKQVDP